MSKYTEIQTRWKDTRADELSNIQIESDADDLIDIIEKQKEALAFYGDKESYICPSPRHYFMEPVLKDDGKRARTVLALTEESGLLRKDLGTFDIDTTPEELQKLREE